MSRTYDIAVIPGDGIGPEVVREGLRVLDRVAAIEGFVARPTRYPFGAEHYLRTKEIFPESAFGEVKGQHAILLKDKRPEHVDFVVVRENTEDAYAGMRGFFKKGTPDEVATQEIIFTRKGVERVIRYAFELARRRARGRKLTLIDKANAVRAMDLWTRTFAEVGAEYPDIAREHNYIDAACMYVVKNPEWFDTVVTSNMFGDIFTDLAAMIQGGLGVAASGNIHPGRVSLFEPIHGSAPKHAGQNVANPIATVMAVQMMLDFLGEARGAARIEAAVAGLLSSRRLPSLGTDSGLSTTQVGDLVLAELERVRVPA